MAIIEIDEMGVRGGSLRLEGMARVYTRQFKVITSGATVSQLEVMIAEIDATHRIPRLGESYAAGNYYDTGAIVDEIAPEQPDEDLPTFWLVTVTYRSFPSNLVQNTQGGGGGSPGDPQSSNPLFQPLRVTWGTKKKLKALRRSVARDDLDEFDGPGNTKLPPRNRSVRITNTAGTPFDPPPQQEISYRTVTVIRNEPEFRPFTSQIYVGRVNKEIFQRQPPGCAICDDIDAEYGYADGVAYFSVTYRFSFAPLLDNGQPDRFFWYPTLVNKGPRYLDAAPPGGKLTPYIDKLGRNGNQAYLASDGTVAAGFNLETGQLDVNASTLDLIFPDRKSIDFDELNLPPTLWL